MATVNVFLKERKTNKAGEAPIKLLVYSSGKKREKTLGIRVRPEQWDAEKRRVRKNHPQSSRMNQLISEKRAELLALAIEVEQGKKSLEHKSIRELTSGGGDGDFFEAMERMVSIYLSDEKFSTSDLMANAGKHLKRFVADLGWKRLSFADFNREIAFPPGEKIQFLEGFKRFALSKGLAPGTIRAYMLKYYRVFNDKIQNKQLNPDLKPLVKLPPIKSRTVFLTPNELEQLRKMDLNRYPKRELVRDMYIFSAYAGGLRISDVLTLGKDHIRGGILDKNTIKTGAHITFRLGEIPLGIIRKYQNKEENGLIFPFYNAKVWESGSKRAIKDEFNRCISRMDGLLHTLARQLGMEHSMSFHTARHTFATMAVSKGMKITTLQRLMGHSKITQTQTYWHLLGADIDDDVAAFNAQCQDQSKAQPVQQQISPTLPPGVEMLRFYALQTAQMQAPNLSPAFAGVVVNPYDLEAYQKETSLPDPLRKRVTVRVFAYSAGPVAGDELKALEGLQKALNGNSLFGAGVLFEVAPAGREMVVEWIGDGVEWAA